MDPELLVVVIGSCSDNSYFLLFIVYLFLLLTVQMNLPKRSSVNMFYKPWHSHDSDNNDATMLVTMFHQQKLFVCCYLLLYVRPVFVVK